MPLIKHVVLISLEFIIILFHSCGLYLLNSLLKDGRLEVCHIYIMNLGATEIILNMNFLVLYVVRTINEYNDAILNYKQANKYLLLIMQTVVSFSYYVSMLLITIDKALDVRLNIRYPIYCTFKTAKYFVCGTWIVGSVIFISIAIGHEVSGFSYQATIGYAHLTLDFTFICVAVFSYGYIFHKFRQTREIPTASQSCTSRQNIFQVFRNSRFFVAGLLILSFLVLLIFPDLLFTFGEFEGIAVGIIATTLTHLNFVSDAVIYIFMDRLVKGMLYKKLRHLGILRPAGVSTCQQRNAYNMKEVACIDAKLPVKTESIGHSHSAQLP